MAEFRFTLFTATYNRKDTLPRLFESIKALSYDSFEWLIVDDGSTDGTDKLIAELKRKSHFSIRYIWQENAHKKTAWNKGVKMARGEFFVPIDSDDTLTSNALHIFEAEWNSISKNERSDFIGVTCLCIDKEGRIVGDRFPSNRFVSDSLKLFFNDRIDGEKFGMSRVEVLREFPFPEELPDLVPEGVVWFRASVKYKTLFSNKVVRVYYDDVEGLTRVKRSSMYESRHKRRLGAVLSYKEALELAEARQISLFNYRLTFVMLQYWRWSFYCDTLELRKMRPIIHSMKYSITLALIRPFGRVIFLTDKWIR